MEISFEFLRDTIEINKDVMLNNAVATNDMLVDDILLELGYNRKRDVNVKRLYNEELDWNITNGDKVILVKVIPYNEEVRLDNDIIEGDIYIKTNGINLGLALRNGNKNVYLDLRQLSDTDGKILGYLSKDGFNYGSLEEITRYKEITEDEVKGALSDDKIIQGIYGIIIDSVNADDTPENFETVKSVIINSGTVEIEQVEPDNKELDNLKLELENANGTILALNTKIEQLESKQEQQSLDETGSITSEQELQYRKQIEKLHKEKSEQQDEITKLNNTIRELNDKIANDKSNVQKQAYDLISAIEDDEEMPRSYVGVVNNKLFQEDSLRRFVGICIEKLYELESFNIMPLLFDGDVFKIRQNGEQVDFLINTKEYEINLEDETEESVLLKLKTLFNKFNNIAFECKTIGTYVETEEIEEYDDDELIELTEEDDEVLLDDEYSDDELDIDTSEFFDDSLELESLTEQQEDDIIGREIDEEDYVNTSLVVKIAKLSEVVWHDNIRNISLKGIAVGKKKYRIDSEDAINNQLVQIIDALLTNTPNFEDTIKTLMQKDFNGVSFAIKESGPDLVSIPFSKVGIDTLPSVSMIVPIINEIVSSLKVDIMTVELYIKADIPSDSPLNKYAVDFGEIMEYTNESECQMTGQTGALVISGNITDMTLLNSSVTDMYYKLLSRCLAVKTNYLQERLDTIDGKVKAFETIFHEFRGDKINLANALGTIVGTETKIMSTNENEVSADHYEITLSGKTVYVSELSAFELTFTLIRLHSYINKNKSIGIQVEIDLGAYNFYKDKLVTTDTRKALSVYTIINYVKARMK